MAVNKKYDIADQCFITAFNQCSLIGHLNTLKYLKYAIITSMLICDKKNSNNSNDNNDDNKMDPYRDADRNIQERRQIFLKGNLNIATFERLFDAVYCNDAEQFEKICNEQIEQMSNDELIVNMINIIRASF